MTYANNEGDNLNNFAARASAFYDYGTTYKPRCDIEECSYQFFLLTEDFDESYERFSKQRLVKAAHNLMTAMIDDCVVRVNLLEINACFGDMMFNHTADILHELRKIDDDNARHVIDVFTSQCVFPDCLNGVVETAQRVINECS